MQLTFRKIILPLILILQTVYCWRCFYKAQFLDYDDNYGVLIRGFIISILTMIILIILWFKKKQIIKETIIANILWILLGSPLTFIIAIMYYENIFKASLKT